MSASFKEVLVEYPSLTAELLREWVVSQEITVLHYNGGTKPPEWLE